MTITGKTVSAINDAVAGLELTTARIEELPIELNQLKSAIEAVSSKVAFDIEPSDFVSVLLDLAGAVR